MTAHPYDLLATELRGLAEAEGAELWRNRIRLIGLLLDAQPELRREIRAIVTGVEEGVATALSDTERSLSGIAIDRQANLLETETGLRPEIALNVARTIAHALNLGPVPSVYGHGQAAPTPTPPRPIQRPEPMPPPQHLPQPAPPPQQAWSQAYDPRSHYSQPSAKKFPLALTLVAGTVLIGGGVLAATMLPLGGNGASPVRNIASGPTPTPRPSPTPTPSPSPSPTPPPTNFVLGNWEYVFSATGVESSTAPPEILAKMRTQMGAPQRRTFCLMNNDTSNMAQQISSQLSSSMGQQATCNMWKETIANGVIDLAGTCQSPTSTVEMAITGTYTPTTSNTDMVLDLDTNGQSIRIRANETGRHTGPCP